MIGMAIIMSVVTPATPQVEVSPLFLDVLAWVESNGVPDAIGDGGKAVGAYQIHAVMVDECNRLMKRRYGRGIQVEPFTLADRMNPTRSRLMACIFLNYWGPRMAKKHHHAMTDQDLLSLWRWGSTRWHPKCIQHPVDVERWSKADGYLAKRNQP